MKFIGSRLAAVAGALSVLLIAAGPATSTTLNLRYGFEASNFVLVGGSGVPLASSVTGGFTINFDEAINHTNSSAGLVLESLNPIILSSTFVFSYDSVADRLIVGGLQGSQGASSVQFSPPTNDFAVRIDNATSANPIFSVFLYTQTNQTASFRSTTRSLTVTDLDALSQVPGPAALPLFATGLGALGWAVRRRKRNQHGWLAAIFATPLVVSFSLFVGLANAASVVNIQPVSICLDNGTSCGAAAFDTNAIKTFWQNEAGLTLNFLTPRTFNNTALQTIDSAAEVEGFLLTSPSLDPNGPANFLSAPLTFWYSDATPASAIISRAIVGANRSWVISNATEDAANIGFSRALGFNLGLSLVDASNSSNLMLSLPLIANDPFSSLRLNDQQRAIAQQSRFVEEISLSETPVPPAAFLFATVLAGGGLLSQQRRKRNQFAG